MHSARRVAIGMGLPLLWLALPAQARAFCLAQSCDPDNSAGVICEKDASGCSVAGTPLRRSSRCVTVAVAMGSTQKQIGIDDGTFGAIVVEAFSLWTNVDCGGGRTPGLKVQFAGAVPTVGPFTCEALPDRNVDVWQVTDAFPSPSGVTQTTGAIAGRTRPIFTLPSGKIFDADVDLNGLWLSLFSEDPVRMRGILRTVAAHEAGHALGLAHSLDPKSLMFRSYEVMPMRLPTPDDIRGICALFPPAALQCTSPTVSTAALRQEDCDSAVSAQAGGCSIGLPNSGKSGPGGAGLGLIAGAIFLVVSTLRLGTQSSRHRQMPGCMTEPNPCATLCTD